MADPGDGSAAMRKILASVGIGNASVDTVLPSSTVQPGETITAEVRIDGGDAEQDVSYIDLDVETRVQTEEGYDDIDVDKLRLSEAFTIQPGESTTRETEVTIPETTPLTLGGVDVWIETELGIDFAVDPEDVDHLDVQPTPRMQAVFDALDGLGLSLRKSKCEYDRHNRYTEQRFVQEFEFRPSGGPFAGDLDELEVIFAPSGGQLTVYLEVDRRGGLLSEALDVDERKTSITVTGSDVDAIQHDLRSTVEQNL